MSIRVFRRSRTTGTYITQIAFLCRFRDYVSSAERPRSRRQQNLFCADFFAAILSAKSLQMYIYVAVMQQFTFLSKLDGDKLNEFW